VAMETRDLLWVAAISGKPHKCYRCISPVTHLNRKTRNEVESDREEVITMLSKRFMALR